MRDKKRHNNNNFSKSNYNQRNNKNSPNKNYIYRVGSFYPKKLVTVEEKKDENDNESEKNNNTLKEYIDKIKINIFEYYCLRKLSKKKGDIYLFKSAISLFKKRMDIINVFNLLFLTEKNCFQIEN